MLLDQPKKLRNVLRICRRFWLPASRAHTFGYLEEVQELGDQAYDKYLCSNRTCELGMNLATGKDYRSVIFLLEELPRS
jgi:hypothetical protein